MSLSDLASLGSFVSGLAILVSLIYAGLQLRAFAKAAHESRVVAWNADIQQFRMAIASDPDVARIYRDGLKDHDGLENIDQWRFGALMQVLVANFYLAIEFKDISASAAVEPTYKWILRRPGARVCWPKARHMFSPTVVSVIDHALSEGEE